MNKLKILLIAGEASGDVLGGKLMAAIKKQVGEDKSIEFLGIGGQKMEEQGLRSLFPISELSLMGFAEIVPHIPKLLRRIRQTADFIIREEPDLVITIDAPDFCFRVMKKLKENPIFAKIKKTHFIAPSVWAYRENRAEKISQLYDLLLAILPFEPPYFEKYGLKTAFIGHPIVEEFNPGDGEHFRNKHEVKEDDILICLMPGSRIGEIKRIMPEMIGAVNILVKKYPNIKVVIPTIPKTYEFVKGHLGRITFPTILVDSLLKNDAFRAANFAIAKSGTNTLELAIAKVPMIVTYKANILTFLIIKILSKVKFANLINLILNKEVIPEMLQLNCDAGRLATKLDELICDSELAQKQIDQSQEALRVMGMGSEERSSDKAAREVLRLI